MKLDARAGVSIVEIALFFPCLVGAIFTCKRHGFGRSSGWIYTLILCVIRIVGSCCQLATYSDDSKGLLETTIILDSVGISPLLLATLGLLSKSVDSVQDSATGALKAVHFRLLQLLVTVGLILAIAGGTSGTTSTGTYKAPTTSKVGIALYLIAYVALVVIAFMTMRKISHAGYGESKLVVAVLVALPFILVRLAYSTISIFLHSHYFNFLTGSVIVLALMTVLMEFIVVFIYLVVGWRTQATQAGPIASRPWKGPLTGGNGRRSNGPIRGLIGLAVAASQRPDDVEGGKQRAPPAY